MKCMINVNQPDVWTPIFVVVNGIKKQSLFGVTSEGLLKPNENQIFSESKVPPRYSPDNTPIGVYLYPHRGILLSRHVG